MILFDQNICFEMNEKNIYKFQRGLSWRLTPKQNKEMEKMENYIYMNTPTSNSLDKYVTRSHDDFIPLKKLKLLKQPRALAIDMCAAHPETPTNSDVSLLVDKRNEQLKVVVNSNISESNPRRTNVSLWSFVG